MFRMMGIDLTMGKIFFFSHSCASVVLCSEGVRFEVSESVFYDRSKLLLVKLFVFIHTLNLFSRDETVYLSLLNSSPLSPLLSKEETKTRNSLYR